MLLVVYVCASRSVLERRWGKSKQEPSDGQRRSGGSIQQTDNQCDRELTYLEIPVLLLPMPCLEKFELVGTGLSEDRRMVDGERPAPAADSSI